MRACPDLSQRCTVPQAFPENGRPYRSGDRCPRRAHDCAVRCNCWKTLCRDLGGRERPQLTHLFSHPPGPGTVTSTGAWSTLISSDRFQGSDTHVPSTYRNARKFSSSSSFLLPSPLLLFEKRLSHNYSVLIGYFSHQKMIQCRIAFQMGCLTTFRIHRFPSI